MMGFGKLGFGNPVGLFFRKLALLVGSGVPLAEALDAIAQGLTGGQGGPGAGMPRPMVGRVRQVLSGVADSVRRGGTLASALEAHPGVFPPDLVAIVRSGETAGNLHQALVRIADALEDGTLRAGKRRLGMPWFMRGHAHAHGHGFEHPGEPGHVHVHAQVRTQSQSQSQGQGQGHSAHATPPPGFAPPPADDLEVVAPAALFAAAVHARASDVHIEPLADGGRVRFRVDGRLREHQRIASAAEYAKLVASIKDWAALDTGERRLPQDARAALTVGGQRVRLRLSTSPYFHGEAVTARLLTTSEAIPTLENLSFSERDLARVKGWLARSHGLITVTGPTGCGKSTTLYSMLQSFDNATRKVVTVEQPVEFVIDGTNQLSLAPELGLTWQTALRTQLKHDPDVVMVGEVPSAEVAELVFKTALTGHVVLTIFHADSVAALFGRAIAAGLAPALIQEVLTGVISQRLVRRLCTDCRERIDAPQLPPETQRAFSHMLGGSYRAVFADETGRQHEVQVALPPGTYFRPRGCPACAGTGYRGRIPLYELAEPVPALIPLLARGASTQEVSVALVEAGMRSVLADGIEKASQGHTSLDEVLRECLF